MLPPPSINRQPEDIYVQEKSLKREDVAVIQEWLKKQQHLPRLTDFQVILFLHSCYNSIEQTKATIDLYFTRRTHNIHVFAHLNEDELRRTSEATLVTVLPKVTHHGYNVLFYKFLDFKTENFVFNNATRLVDMVSSLYMTQKGPIEGGIIVFDIKGFSLGHLTKMNPMIMKQAMDHVQEGAPIRIKGIHIISAVPFMDRILSFVRPFLKSDLFSLIQVHSSLETFYEYVPKECLPEEYGGDIPSCQVLKDENLKNLLQNYEFFQWHDSLKVDESKRLDQNSNYGMKGSFRKLEFD